MRVKEFAQKTGFKIWASDKALEREIAGVFVGDLLSWVIGNCEADQIWITVQSHLNSVAVSALKEISVLVIAQGAPIEQEMIDKALEEDIALCACELPAYEICKKCVELGL